MTWNRRDMGPDVAMTVPKERRGPSFRQASQSESCLLGWRRESGARPGAVDRYLLAIFPRLSRFAAHVHARGRADFGLVWLVVLAAQAAARAPRCGLGVRARRTTSHFSARSLRRLQG